MTCSLTPGLFRRVFDAQTLEDFQVSVIDFKFNTSDAKEYILDEFKTL